MRTTKLLLDENLSPAVAIRLRGAGLDVVHVRDRGLVGARDAHVLDRALDEDRVLVTANIRDFDRLARARELHPGIVLIEDSELTRDEQEGAVRKALDAISEEQAQGRDIVCRLLRIDERGAVSFDEPMVRY